MAFNCGVSFGACLGQDHEGGRERERDRGNNTYVSDKPVSINVNPNIETGNNFPVRNGCGCKIASRKFPDTFNCWELYAQHRRARAADDRVHARRSHDHGRRGRGGCGMALRARLR